MFVCILLIELKTCLIYLISFSFNINNIAPICLSSDDNKV